MGQLRCDCEKTPPPQKKHSQVGPTLANFQLTISSDVGWYSDIHKAFTILHRSHPFLSLLTTYPLGTPGGSISLFIANLFRFHSLLSSPIQRSGIVTIYLEGMMLHFLQTIFLPYNNSSAHSVRYEYNTP